MEQQAVDVFVVHDGVHGEQAADFLGVLRVLLEQAHGVSVFVDDNSLEVGSQETIAEKLAAAAVGGTIVITGYLCCCLQWNAAGIQCLTTACNMT